jgi:hypothetical protein
MHDNIEMIFESLEYPADYESLVYVLRTAIKRVADGKGHERHGTNQPFEKQFLCNEMRHELHSIKPALYQIRKKSKEVLRMHPESAQKELLDIIIYAAATYIVLGEITTSVRNEDGTVRLVFSGSK